MFDHKKLTQGVLYGLFANMLSVLTFVLLVSLANPYFLSVLKSSEYFFFVLGTTAVIAFLTQLSAQWTTKKLSVMLSSIALLFVAWLHTIPDGRLLFQNDPWLYLYTAVAVGILLLGAFYYKNDAPQKILILIGLLGIILTVNLTYIHYKLLYDPDYVSPCTAGESISCDAVNSSDYAEVFGVPVALLGMGFYLFVIVMAWLSTPENRKTYGDLGQKLLLFGSIAGLSFTLYLTAIEAFVLYIWCPLCVVSAFLSVCIFANAIKSMDVDPFTALNQPGAAKSAQTTASVAVAAPSKTKATRKGKAPAKRKR